MMMWPGPNHEVWSTEDGPEDWWYWTRVDAKVRERDGWGASQWVDGSYFWSER